MKLAPGRVRICRRSELAPLQRVDVEGHRVLLVDLGDEIVALDDTCSHENASLAAEGEVDADAREIECCRHGARFSLDDGSATSFPATEALRTYRVLVEDGDVVLEVS